ncbi:MAG: carboxypeptidase-like regulatory domain-containing protein [Bradymonadia bacterium]
MMRAFATVYALCTIVSMLMGCGEIEAIHPLDPDTPAAFQAPAKLQGRLITPTGFDLGSVDEVKIHLDPLNANLVSRTGSVAETGIFLIEDVIPGSYRLTVWGPGVGGGPFLVDIQRGEHLDMGPVILSPVLGQIKGWVFTTDGMPATGALVSTDDRYEVTVVDTEGRFTVRVLEGNRRVTVVLKDHTPWHSQDVPVEAWDDVTMSQPIFLEAEPGHLRGQVGLSQFSTTLRSARIRMALLPTEIGNGGENEPADRPDDAPDTSGLFRDTRIERRDFELDPETGDFMLHDVVPGSYLLEIRAPGYQKQTWPVVIHARVPSVLGRFELNHLSNTSQAVQLSGRVRTGGVGLVAIGLDISIESTFGDPPVHYGRVVTDSNGEFSIPVAADELYSISGEAIGFPDIEGGPFRYIQGQGFRSIDGTVPDFNLGPASQSNGG